MTATPINARPHAEAVADSVRADVGHDQQMHRVAEMADAPRPQAPASGQPEHGGDAAGSNPAPVPNSPMTVKTASGDNRKADWK